MAERGQINTGDEVKDSITGFSGVAICISSWLNGCVRVTIQPRELHEGKPIDAQTFDVEQIEVVKSATHAPLRKTGGPHDAPRRQSNPSR